MIDEHRGCSKTIEQLRDRVNYLEENRRFFQNALEMVLGLADFRNTIDGSDDVDIFLEEAAKRVAKIIPLKCSSFFLVDEQSFEFKMAFCTAESLSGSVKDQVEVMIEEGHFAWAVRERKGVFAPVADHGELLLHVIANHSGVKGMFVGVLAGDQQAVSQSTMILVSIILFNLANIIEV